MKININVKSERQGEGKNEFSAEGTLSEKDGVKYISYKEPDLGGMSTTLKINKNAVTLIRFGDGGMRLEFVKGKKTGSLYRTPYGNFEMNVIPDKVYSRTGEKEGEVFLIYTLDFAGERSHNKMKLEYKVQEGI